MITALYIPLIVLGLFIIVGGWMMYSRLSSNRASSVGKPSGTKTIKSDLEKAQEMEREEQKQDIKAA